MAQAEARQRALTSIDVSDPRRYQKDSWRPLFAKLRRDDPVHYCEASRFGPYWSVTHSADSLGGNFAAGPLLRDLGAAAAALFEFHSRYTVVTGANPLLGIYNERSR